MKRRDDTNSPTLTVRQLLDRWHITAPTLRRRRQEGLRAMHIGRRVLFQLAEVERFEREATV